jgi:hypothetical protein
LVLAARGKREHREACDCECQFKIANHSSYDCGMRVF